MTPRSEKDYRASSITSFILSAAWRPPQAMTGRGTFLAFLLWLELDVEAPSYYFIYSNERQA
jgi:hypothetical protein